MRQHYLRRNLASSEEMSASTQELSAQIHILVDSIQNLDGHVEELSDMMVRADAVVAKATRAKSDPELKVA